MLLRDTMRALLLLALLLAPGCATPAAERSATPLATPELVEHRVYANGSWTASAPDHSLVGSGWPAFQAPPGYTSAQVTIDWTTEAAVGDMVFRLADRTGKTTFEKPVPDRSTNFSFRADDPALTNAAMARLESASYAAAEIKFSVVGIFRAPR